MWRSNMLLSRLLPLLTFAALLACGSGGGQSGADMAPQDAALPPVDAQPDLACTRMDQGPGCCYPTCKPAETLICLGDNICGYPCSCEPLRDGSTPQDLACVPNQGPGCCYPTCQPGQVLSCLGANICGYPCSCVAAKDSGI